MAFNKFTQITPAHYDARSLQETLYLPTLKRQQHDQLDQSLAKTQAAMSKYDNLDLHDPIIQAEKEKLTEKIEQQASTLAKQGINSGSKTNFLNLASEFQEAVGPEGKIGKAKLIKDNYIKNREAVKQRMIKDGYSGKEAEYYLQKQFEDYKKAYNGEDLNEISLLDAPKYMNIEEEFKKLKPLLGDNTKETIQKLGGKGYRVGIDDTTGKFVVMTPKGSLTTKSNIPQLNLLTEMLNQTFTREGSRGKESLEIQGISKEEAEAKINNLAGLSSQTVVRDTRGYSYNLSSNPNNPNLPENKPGKFSVSVNRSSPLNLGIENMQDLEMKATPQKDASEQEILEARKFSKIKNQVETAALQNPKYRELNNDYNKLKQEFNTNYAQELSELEQIYAGSNPAGGSYSTATLNYFENNNITQEQQEQLKNKYYNLKEKKANLEELREKKYESLNELFNAQVIDNTQVNFTPSTSAHKNRFLDTASQMLSDKKNTTVNTIQYENPDGDPEKIDPNSEEANKFTEWLATGSLGNSEITNVSLIDNGMSKGIRMSITVDDKFKEVLGDDIKEGAKVDIVVEPKDLYNKGMPTPFAKYVVDNFGQEGKRAMEAYIQDSRHTGTSDITQVGQHTVDFNNYLPGVSDNNEGIDFHAQGFNLGNETVSFETPYLINTENGKKEKLTIPKYIEQLESLNEGNLFSEVLNAPDQKLMGMLKQFYKNAKLTRPDKFKDNKSFEDQFYTKDEDGDIIFDTNKYSKILENIPVLLRSAIDKSDMSLISYKFR